METGASPFRLQTIGDVRAALLAGHGFAGDEEAFELDVQRAREATSGTDLTAVIVDYRDESAYDRAPSSAKPSRKASTSRCS
ncbi:hypothetical protein [Streptomyces sp. NPDC057336]|uniref:hypothetical protein n=1 Tax=Streptomyces sp. NPDC057336 TaxID=3346102 RepID=UPI00362D1D54